MKKIKVQINVLLRVAGSVSLTLGVFFSVFGVFNRTVSAIFLWISLLIGIFSLFFAYWGGRSWYSGIIISGATYFFLITRTSSANSILGAMAITIALSAALYGVFLNPCVKSFKDRLFK